jgi:hypothetical protein
MLWNSSAIKDYAIVASDGRLGSISDFLFDDDSWLIRWLVVDTGTWLSGRKVLLPVSVLGHLDSDKREFSVQLNRQQVKDSPDIDTDRPVSRQMETHTFDYYGWSPYWGTGFYTGGYGPGELLTSPELGAMRRHADQDLAARQRKDDDWHLRSIGVVTSYHIHAEDGAIGQVEDFLIDDADWSIRYLAVDTANWWAGKKVLISPKSVRDIDWTEKRVELDVDRQQVKGSPAYDESTKLDEAYVGRFRSHYEDGARHARRS